jgi:hypothetical protein
MGWGVQLGDFSRQAVDMACPDRNRVEKGEEKLQLLSRFRPSIIPRTTTSSLSDKLQVRGFTPAAA